MSQVEFNREIQRLFKLAVKDAFYSSDAMEVLPSDANQSINDKFNEFYLLTISSQAFRVLTLIHLNNNEATKAYVAHKLNCTNDAVSDERLYDYIGELGNTLCGSLKRSINQFVPSLGMSTPNRLENGSIKYMMSQKPSLEAYSQIEVNGQTLFECSVYVCNDVELNIQIPTNSHAAVELEDTDCGELELF